MIAVNVFGKYLFKQDQRSIAPTWYKSVSFSQLVSLSDFQSVIFNLSVSVCRFWTVKFSLSLSFSQFVLVSQFQ